VIAPRYRWQVQMLQRAPLVLVGGTAIPVIDLVDLIVMKLKAGGVKDDADAANLFSAMSGRPDLLERLQATARRLGVDRKLNRLMRAKR
jgi:predicted nucleotidyltransferase